jgi:hypothetical protein
MRTVAITASPDEPERSAELPVASNPAVGSSPLPESNHIELFVTIGTVWYPPLMRIGGAFRC